MTVTRRLVWFVFVTCVVAGINVGVQWVSEAQILDYRVPASVAQEVAGVALAKYIRDCSWEKAHYTYYISSVDKRIDVDQLIRKMPTLPNVLIERYAEGVQLQTLEDLMQAKLKSIATIESVDGTWKRVRVIIGRYVSPLGITSIYYTLERGWWRWQIVGEASGNVLSFDQNEQPNKAPEPTPGLVTPRAMKCAFEMNRRNGNRDAARGAPSPVVAHL
jgi:hypothetical protein